VTIAAPGRNGTPAPPAEEAARPVTTTASGAEADRQPRRNERRDGHSPDSLDGVSTVVILAEDATPAAPAVERQDGTVTFRLGKDRNLCATKADLYAMLPPCLERRLLHDPAVEFYVGEGPVRWPDWPT
jgi:hypothetical protein